MRHFRRMLAAVSSSHGMVPPEQGTMTKAKFVQVGKNCCDNVYVSQNKWVRWGIHSQIPIINCTNLCIFTWSSVVFQRAYSHVCVGIGLQLKPSLILRYQASHCRKQNARLDGISSIQAKLNTPKALAIRIKKCTNFETCSLCSYYLN